MDGAWIGACGSRTRILWFTNATLSHYATAALVVFDHLENRDIWMTVVFAGDEFSLGTGFLSFFLGAGLRGIGGGRCFFFVARLSDSRGFLTGVQRF